MNYEGTRTNTNPNGTEADAAGTSGNARVLRKQCKCGMIQEGDGHWPNSSKNCKKRGFCECCALRRTIKRKARESKKSLLHAEHEVRLAEVKLCLWVRSAPEPQEALRENSIKGNKRGNPEI